MKIEKHKQGTIVKIICGGSGAYGCNGKVGIITDKDPDSGSYFSGIKVLLSDGQCTCKKRLQEVWGMGRDYKLELIKNKNGLLKEFAKSDLVVGRHLIEFESGRFGLIMDKWIQYIDIYKETLDGWDHLDIINEDLNGFRNVKRVYKINGHFIFHGKLSGNSTLIWERKPKKTQAEIELEDAESLLKEATDRVRKAKEALDQE